MGLIKDRSGLIEKCININNKAVDVEEPELLEELLEFEEEESSVIGGAGTGGIVLSDAGNHFQNSFFPVLFIDRKMRILYSNTACENLFNGFFELQGHYFVDVFGHAFSVESIRKIRETIMGGNSTFSWKGEVKIKSRNVATVQTKVYIFPAELKTKEPEQFVVMFDDITEENRRLVRSVFMSLLEASKLKDNDTGSHILRVNLYSKRLSQELFLYNSPKYNRIDADFINDIGFLSAMHDVGKIGTPDDILNKKGPLSEMEWSIMREHTKNGAFILSTYPNPMAREIALSHHERWDGSGYPYQLSEEMIPLAARITTIADVYDALRMVRSYKSFLSHSVTLSKMVEGRETHFDPFLFDIFIKINKDFEDIYESNSDEK